MSINIVHILRLPIGFAQDDLHSPGRTLASFNRLGNMIGIATGARTVKRSFQISKAYAKTRILRDQTVPWMIILRFLLTSSRANPFYTAISRAILSYLMTGAVLLAVSFFWISPMRSR